MLALVRELRERTGVDCGEPCEDQPRQNYVLNVLYAEQPTDPVAPYAHDDCAVGDCEFSRVREGYRFELSCEAPELEPNVIDKLRECLGVDDRKVREKAAAMTRVVQLAKAHQVGVIAEAEVAIPRKEEFDRLEGAPVAVANAVDLLGRSVAVLAQDAAAHEGRARSLGINATRRDLLSKRSRDLARRVLASDELKMLDESERRDGHEDAHHRRRASRPRATSTTRDARCSRRASPRPRRRAGLRARGRDDPHRGAQGVRRPRADQDARSTDASPR